MEKGYRRKIFEIKDWMKISVLVLLEIALLLIPMFTDAQTGAGAYYEQQTIGAVNKDNPSPDPQNNQKQQQGEDWEYVCTSTSGKYFYGTKSLILSGNNMRVMVKQDYPKGGIVTIAKVGLLYTVTLWDLDLMNKKGNLLITTLFKEDGNVISQSHPTEWISFDPSTPMDHVIEDISKLIQK